MSEDEYEMVGGDAVDPVDDGVDAFANVGQGLVGAHKTAMLQYWQQVIDDIERISDDGSDTDVFKSTVSPLARIKKVMKTDLDVKMISAEAPILFAKGCDIFITELTMRAWIHAEENKRRTLQRSDIAMAIQKSDVFDFSIDIIPREEAQPRRAHRFHDHSNSFSSHNSGSADFTNGISGGGVPNIGSMPSNMPNSAQHMANGLSANIPGSLSNGIPGSLNVNAPNGNGMQMNPMNLSMSQSNQSVPPQQQLSQQQLSHQQMQQSHHMQQQPSQLNPSHLAQMQQSSPQQSSHQNTPQSQNGEGQASPHQQQQSQQQQSQQFQQQPQSRQQHNQLNTLTDVANSNIDINSINPMASLGPGIDSQITNSSYPGIDYGRSPQNVSRIDASAYLDGPVRPSPNGKNDMKQQDNDVSASKQGHASQDGSFTVKSEASDEAPFSSESPFAYNESVDVAPFGQNF